MMSTIMNGPRSELNFVYIRQNHNKGILLVPLEINTPIYSLTVSPFFVVKKCYEELDINNVCVLNIKARFIFFDQQNHNINSGIDAFV